MEPTIEPACLRVDPQQFGRQRQLLESLLDDGRLTATERIMLEGLWNFTAEVADYLLDEYGIDA